MTDEIFILQLKALYKNYFQNDRSAGMEVRRLVRQFREEIQEENFKIRPKKRKIINRTKTNESGKI
jgi:hypothetical protein